MTAVADHPQTAVDQAPGDTQSAIVDGPNLPHTDRDLSDTHHGVVGVGDQTAVDQGTGDTQTGCVDGPNLPHTDHVYRDAQVVAVGVGDRIVVDQPAQDIQTGHVDGPNIPHTGQAATDTHAVGAGVGGLITERGAGYALLADPTLYMLAENVTDVEAARKAVYNRIGTLTRTGPDADGVTRGHGLPETHSVVRSLLASAALLDQSETAAVAALEKAMRAHPLGPWVAAQRAVGLKTMGRVLGVIGDPYWHNGEQRPTRVSELWSYCGLGDAARQVRRKGVKANWSTEAKTRLWNCVPPIVKCRDSPYRAVYDAAKASYVGAVHAAACVRCGPKGHPAAAGSPVSKAHIEARAYRAVMKALLRDLWLESRRLHELAAAAAAATES